jgi:L-Ala-D/L-Glu epimerase
MTLRLDLEAKTWRMREPFVIARSVMTHLQTISITLTDENGVTARGEACGVDYAGETPAGMIDALEALRPAIEAGLSRQEALEMLPAGGARCALDAALWDLEAKKTPGGLAALIGAPLKPVLSAYTIGMRDLADYEATARRYAQFPLLKVKVGRDDPLAAIAAVHRGAPNARLIVDPNQAWSPDELKALADGLKPFPIALLEQPVPVGSEVELEGWRAPFPLAADELINETSDLDKAAGRFDVINIKLDKCGGLTAALLLADAAKAMGFDLMVGCMAGSSLCMAPALVLAQRCAFVDLDGPLLQSEDWHHPLVYETGLVYPPAPELWG